MSGPNSEYDPVQVTPLDEEHVTAMREQALAAITAASDLDALKRVRTEHAGDRSPLALANRGAPRDGRSVAPARKRPARSGVVCRVRRTPCGRRDSDSRAHAR